MALSISVTRYASNFLTFGVDLEWGNPDDIPAVYSGIRTGFPLDNHLIYRPSLVVNKRELYPSLKTVYTDSKWLYGLFPLLFVAFCAGNFSESIISLGCSFISHHFFSLTYFALYSSVLLRSVGLFSDFSLVEPQFVASFSTKNHVYFFFREVSVEHQPCGPIILSRVARVCKVTSSLVLYSSGD